MPNKATRISFHFAQLSKLSFSGLPAVAPASFIARKTGLSLSFNRTQSETASRTSEKMKGTRQPQASHWPGSTNLVETRTTMTERRKPPITLAWMKLV